MPRKYVKRPRRELLHLPIALWPQIDRELLEKAFSPGKDLFDEQGSGAHLRPRTIELARFAWRRWLGWLLRTNPVMLSRPPADRVAPELVKGFIEHLRETNGSVAVAAQIGFLHSACRYMMPDDDWSWLRRLKSRLEAVAQPKKKAPIPITSDRLADLGEEMMDEAEARIAELGQLKRSQQCSLARLHRDGLMICMEALFGPRRTSLAAMRLGTSLRKVGDVWIVDIEEENVKNAQRIRATLPLWLSQRLDTYLEFFRPLFRDATSHGSPWASQKGRMCGGEALYEAFRKRLWECAGLTLTLHDARRIGVTTWAIEDPETVGGARDLLGDKSAAVIAKHYNQAGSIEASRKMATLIEKLKGH